MRCGLCGDVVRLTPSAAERARLYGGRPSDYTKLFPNHAECELALRKANTTALMRRYARGADHTEDN